MKKLISCCRSLCCVLICFPCSSLFGTTSDDISMTADRPGFSKSALAVAGQSLQIENGYTFSHSEDITEHTIGELLVRCGIMGILELRLGINSYVFRDQQGVETSGKDEGNLGMKICFLKPVNKFSLWTPGIAIIIGTNLPSSSDVKEKNTYEPEARLALDFPITPELNTGVNLNYIRMGDETGKSGGIKRYSQYSGTLSIRYMCNNYTGFSAEYFTVFNKTSKGDRANYFDIACMLQLSKDFQIDVRAGIGFLPHMKEYFIGTGTVYAIQNMFKI